MAQSKNPLTKGASGMIGKTVVFRTWNGKTFMYNRPSKPKKQSVLQKENRTKFSRAVAFSRSMMAIPERKAEYAEIAKREKLPNAYTAAVTEYMRKPEIIDIDTSGTDQVKIVAKKKGFDIQEVEAILIDENGVVIQEGKAEKGLGDEWNFLRVVNSEFQKATQVIIKVRDRVNNELVRQL
jgi:anti-sigma regulatory factor (Ser/Thr protein kinase)